jgi:methionyl aminopeptidase
MSTSRFASLLAQHTLRLPCSRRHVLSCHRRNISNVAANRSLAPALPNDLEADSFSVDDVPDFGTYSVILPDEPFVYGTSHIQPRSVPTHIARPPYANADLDTAHAYEGESMSVNLPPSAFDGLREAGKLAKEALKYAGSLVRVSVVLASFIPLAADTDELGITTDAIDAAVHDFIVSRNAYPSPLLYKGFPKACCTSVNNVIVHGIPDECVQMLFCGHD